MDQLTAAGAPGAAPSYIKDTNTQGFMRDVVQASSEVPVIVDFWAPWCGPCKQLTPVLEKVVNGARGAVRLVKINIDENPEIAQQMRIQSIPAVYAFYKGRPVDGFAGALPESQLREFVRRLTKLSGGGPSPVEEALEAAKQLLDDKDFESAASVYEQILGHEADNPAAIAGLARALVGLGRVDEARQALDRAPVDKQGHADIQAVRSTLDLAEQAAKAGSVGDLRGRLAADPKDHQARYDLAMALYAQGDRDGAVDELLGIVQRDRNWNEEAARKQLVKLFDAFGPTDPLTVSARRRLSSILFS